jgi:dTDP-L-rhamnose 4-epimerase
MADRILITGGAGFIGRRLAQRTLAAGWDVRIVDAFLPQVHGEAPVVPSWLSGDCDLRRGDVRDPDVMRSAVADIDVVFHLAAETGTGQSMYAIQRYVDVNAGGTAVLLEALQQSGDRCRILVNASSRAVYGEGQYHCPTCGIVHPPLRDPQRLARGEWDPTCPSCGSRIDAVATREDAVTRPVSVYGTTKLAQELLSSHYGHAFDTSVVSLRFQNVYGLGQSLLNPYTGILTHFFNTLRRGDSPRVFEDGRESRDFVHVDDVVAALLAAVIADPGHHTVNIGSGVRTTILQLAEAMRDVMRVDVTPVVVGEYRVGDVRHCVADLTRARQLLDYSPAVPLEAGLVEFVAWAASQQPSAASEATANHELAALGLLRSAKNGN